MAGKIAEALRELDLYRDGTKEELKQTFIPEDTVDIGGKSYDLSKLAYWDAKLFADELDNKLVRQNPFIHDIYAKYAVNCLDLVRMVNKQTKQGFKGAVGSGNELDAQPFLAPQFYDPDSTGNPRASWVRTITSTGSKYFFEAIGGSAEISTAEEEGLIWLAWYNPALDPCVNAFKITMNTEPYNIQGLDFMQMHEDQGDPLIEFKEPWTLPPEQSGQIECHYFQTGTDELRPIGLWVKMSKHLRSLTDMIEE